MRIGFFKRATSYLIDIVPLFLLVVASFTWFAGDIIKSQIDNFDHLEAAYVANLDTYNATIEPLYQDFNDGIITYEEYESIQGPIQDDFIHNNSYLIDVVVYQFWTIAVLYVLITFNTLYYAYVLIFKGQTYGRKLMKIELQGNIKWHSLLLREIFWKNLFYLITLSAGIAIDLGFIVFTQKKRTLRDMFSRTYLAPLGVNYPF